MSPLGGGGHEHCRAAVAPGHALRVQRESPVHTPWQAVCAAVVALVSARMHFCGTLFQSDSLSWDKTAKIWLDIRRTAAHVRTTRAYFYHKKRAMSLFPCWKIHAKRANCGKKHA